MRRVRTDSRLTACPLSGEISSMQNGQNGRKAAGLLDLAGRRHSALEIEIVESCHWLGAILRTGTALFCSFRCGRIVPVVDIAVPRRVMDPQRHR